MNIQNLKPGVFAAAAATLLCAAAVSPLVTAVVEAAPKAKPKTTAKTAAKKPAASGAGLAPIRIALPRPAFIGTPKNVPLGTTVEKPTGKPRPPFLAPRGTKNVALGRPVTASDNAPIVGSAELITDGDKEAGEGRWVEFGPGTQWVQIDLGKAHKIYAVVMWHYHGEARVYRDVVLQVADDRDFITNVRTVFNNDQDNTSGRGVGRDREFFEFAEGKLVNAKGVRARYVRLYSRGSTADDQNHYTEVEVYGMPAR